jgi:hypothetical protein
MSSIVSVQKAPESPLASSAMGHLSQLRTPEAMALDFPWDITSPDGIIAFFGAKMKDTDADLKKLMYSQEARNAVIKDAGLLNTLLAKYDGDKMLMPGTPDFAEFQRLSAEISPALGGSADENSVRAALDVSLNTGHVSEYFQKDDAAGRAAFVLAHPSATSSPVPGDSKQIVLSAEDAPNGVNASTCKDIGNKLKTIADSYQQSNQMDTIRVQELVNRISQLTGLASNIVRSFHDAAMGPIGNIK